MSYLLADLAQNDQKKKKKICSGITLKPKI